MKLNLVLSAVALMLSLSACTSTPTKEDQEAHHNYIERFHSRADRN